jgi:FtsH-binding integral membrane protein
MRSEYVDGVKYTVDALSVATVVGALTDMLPEIAALFTIIWTGIRIYETHTIQKIFGKKGKKSDAE